MGDGYSELSKRVTALESFNSDLKADFRVAKAFAFIFGITALLGGGWLTILQNEYSKLSQLHQQNEEVIADLNEKLRNSSDEIDAYIAEGLTEIDAATAKATAEGKKALSTTAIERQSELIGLTSDDLLDQLNDGTHSLRLRSLAIVDESGSVRASLATSSTAKVGVALTFPSSNDSGSLQIGVSQKGLPFSQLLNDSGERVAWLGQTSNNRLGALHLHAEDGVRVVELGAMDNGSVLSLRNPKRTVELKLASNQETAFQEFSRNTKVLLSLGHFNDTKRPFIQGYDANRTAPTFSLSDQKNGGKLVLRSENGDQLVYAGAAKNTNQGLVRVDNPKSGKAAFLDSIE